MGCLSDKESKGASGDMNQSASNYRRKLNVNPEHKVAIKVLDKQKLRDNVDLIMEEVAILNTLDHPNIVKYYETYDDNKYIYLVMEYISGVQLFVKITSQTN